MSYAADRRNFLKFLAASPLLANSALAEGLRWSDPMEWAPRDPGKLITDPTQALDVFDFEPVMKENVPPAHFGYMATGVDDEMTLRANRDGFQKFELRPRRLVDVSKIDMSVEIFGAKFDSPIVIAPTGSNRAFHPDAEIAVAKAAKARQPSADPFDGRHDLDRGCDRRARRAGLVPALYHAEMGGRRSADQARRDRGRAGHCRDARCAIVGEVGDFCPLAPHRHARMRQLPRRCRLSEPQAEFFRYRRSAASAAPPSPT